MKFRKVTSENGFTNCLTGRSSSAVIAINEAGEYGCLPGESTPYMPIGGMKVLKEVKDILIFKPYNF